MGAGLISEFTTSGEYREERLYLLEAVQRLEKKQDEILEQLGAAKDHVAKLRNDCNELGVKFRRMESAAKEIEARLLRMEIRAGSIAALAGVLAGSAVALVKAYVLK